MRPECWARDALPSLLPSPASSLVASCVVQGYRVIRLHLPQGHSHTHALSAENSKHFRRVKSRPPLLSLLFYQVSAVTSTPHGAFNHLHTLHLSLAAPPQPQPKMAAAPPPKTSFLATVILVNSAAAIAVTLQNKKTLRGMPLSLSLLWINALVSFLVLGAASRLYPASNIKLLPAHKVRSLMA